MEETKINENILSKIKIKDKSLEEILDLIYLNSNEDRRLIQLTIDSIKDKIQSSRDPIFVGQIITSISNLYKVKQSSSDAMLKIADIMKDILKANNIEEKSTGFILLNEQTKQEILNEVQSDNKRIISK